MMIYSLSWFLVDIITNEDKMYFFHISNWTEILQCIYFGEYTAIYTCFI